MAIARQFVLTNTSRAKNCNLAISKLSICRVDCCLYAILSGCFRYAVRLLSSTIAHGLFFDLQIHPFLLFTSHPSIIIYLATAGAACWHCAPYEFVVPLSQLNKKVCNADSTALRVWNVTRASFAKGWPICAQI